MLRNGDGNVEAEWIGVIGTLAGTVLGGGLALGGSLYLQRRDRLESRRSVAIAIAVEVSHLCDALSRYHRYLEGWLTESRQRLGNETLQRPLPELRARAVFNANVGQIGKFEPQIARAIVDFYLQVDALAPELAENDGWITKGEVESSSVNNG
jgi:hypothetical protein